MNIKVTPFNINSQSVFPWQPSTSRNKDDAGMAAGEGGSLAPGGAKLDNWGEGCCQSAPIKADPKFVHERGPGAKVSAGARRRGCGTRAP